MIIVFSITILAAIGSLMAVTLNVQENHLYKLMKMQLMASNQSIINDISIMRATLDTRRYENKLSYNMLTMAQDYTERGYHLQQFIVDGNNFKVKPYNSLKNLPFTAKDLQKMFRTKNGIMRPKVGELGYIASFQYSIDTNSLVILMVPERDYLQTVYSQRRLIIIIGLCELIAAYLLIYLLIAKLTRPISLMAEAAEQVEKGNINTTIPAVGNTKELAILAESMDRMLQSINRFIQEVSGIGDNLNGSSSDLQAIAKEAKNNAAQVQKFLFDIAGRVGEQMNAVNDTIVKGRELETLLDGINSSNTTLITTSRNVVAISNEGKEAIDLTQQHMNDMHAFYDITRQDFQSLGLQMEQIAQISTSLGEIAKQTKLLALNALIEAARAGDSGQSFMVVAREVSILAEQAQDSSQKTYLIVNEIMERFQHLNDDISRTYEMMESTLESVNWAGVRFGNIQSRVLDNSQSGVEVAEMVREMSGTINLVMTEFEKVYQHAQYIYSSIPEIVEAVNLQRERTSETMSCSSSLFTFAAQLNDLTKSFDSKQQVVIGA